MRKKFILAFLVILLLWWLLQVPRIVNSLFLFFALGVNPFNNQDLSPVTMARLMALLVVVSVFVIFMKEWLRLGRRIVRAVRRQPAAADQKDARPSRAVHLSASPELALAAVEVEAEATTAEPEEPTSLEPEELQADADQTSAATMPLSDAVDYNPHTGRIVPLAALPSLLAHMSAAAPAKQRRLVRQAQQALQFVVAQGTQAWHAARQAAMAA